MKTLKVLLALITEDNDYQREQAAVATETARKLGVDLKIVYANGDAIAQTQQILGAVHLGPQERPDAVIVEPVGTGMLPVAQAAAHDGIGWLVLNREADYLVPLRQASPNVPIGSIDSDNTEIGRIQGRQVAALLPSGGTMVYIEGPAAEVSKLRRAGLDETLPPNVELRSLRGKWTEESGFQALNSLLLRQGSGPPNIGLIGCQNDAMARGARKAVESLPDPRQREQWLKIPFTGVDGVAQSGLAWVKQGILAATVITPALTGMALEMMSRALGGGAPVPERTLTKPTSHPPLEQLKPR